MESVKILIANKTIGSGKSTIGLALADYIYNQSTENLLQPILFDCSDSLHIYNKRLNELEETKHRIPPYEIIPLSLYEDKLLGNTLDLILEREAVYIFDVSSTISEPLLFRLLFFTDIILCPFVMTDKGKTETNEFISFIRKSLKVFKTKGFDRDPTIIMMPNMVRASGIESHITDYCNEISSSLLPFCEFTSNIIWRDNLLNDLSTTEWFMEFQDMFDNPFEQINNHITRVYRDHFNSNNYSTFYEKNNQ